MTTKPKTLKSALNEISAVLDLLEAAINSAKASSTHEGDGAAAVLHVASNKLSDIQGILEGMVPAGETP